VQAKVQVESARAGRVAVFRLVVLQAGGPPQQVMQTTTRLQR
jgi:hypothetical protein